jgi:hypothetical protein
MSYKVSTIINTLEIISCIKGRVEPYVPLEYIKLKALRFVEWFKGVQNVNEI